MARRTLLSWFDPKRRAIDRYLRDLPPRLLRDYGHGGPYTPQQVQSALARHRIGPAKYAPYAVAIFCDEAALAEIRDRRFADIRRELGETYFGGDAGYSYSDVQSHWAGASESGWAAGEGHGGGEHSGGGHGGHH